MKTKTFNLRASAAIATAGTTTGTGEKLQEVYRRLTVLLDVSAIGAGAGGTDTLDVYVDASPDGGTTWINVGRFTQVTGAQAAQKQILVFNESVNEGTQPVVVTSDLGSAGTRQIGFYSDLRYRGVVVGATADFTYAVKAFAK